MEILNKRLITWAKAGVLTLVGVYFLFYAFDVYRGYFIDGVNVLMHEAGHFIFIFFGDFIRVAGGTIMQLLHDLRS